MGLTFRDYVSWITDTNPLQSGNLGIKYSDSSHIVIMYGRNGEGASAALHYRYFVFGRI